MSIVVSSTSDSSNHSTYSRANNDPRTPTFNEDQENYHRIEFEAPLSAEADSDLHRLQRAQGQGRFSIDYSLELERQLAMESPPETPAHNATTHPSTNDSLHKPPSDSHVNDLGPDPDILAHIITQLRQSLADMTKERAELVKMLATANAQEAFAKDALQVMTDRATEAEEELTTLRKKTKEDEEQIALLRAKVEESRRGLMRLQTESRRHSMAPIDVSRASVGTFTSFASPPSSKRASFVPLTGSSQGKSSGHRRVASVTDANLGGFPTPDQTPSPNVRAFNIASAEASLSAAPSSSRRFSGLFGRQSPNDDMLLSASVAEASTNSLELEALRKEMQTIKDELDTAKHELIEANEAKEASETCVIALRDFIAENNIGVAGPSTTAVKLPPPPTMTTGDESSTDPKKTGTGWGFKLWGGGPVDSPLKSSIGNAPYSASPAASSPMAPPTSMPPPSATIGAAPLSRKLGGFFSSRSSISSNHSRDQSRPQALHLQTNAAAVQLPSQRDSIYSHSDVSSVAEPISPGSDINGLGTATYSQTKATVLGQEDAVVKDASTLDANSVHVSVSASDMELLR
ncbi:hypothetical protein BDZ97DRAFT_1913127 [Flammula alnicola]|nr:hypothetical protein BDZ97DRAFT_1913127 [Flammula alnicola]